MCCPIIMYCMPAGVKYLHHEAKIFDIGIYFEANGHGTVLFKPSLLKRLQDMDEQVSCAVWYLVQYIHVRRDLAGHTAA